MWRTWLKALTAVAAALATGTLAGAAPRLAHDQATPRALAGRAVTHGELLAPAVPAGGCSHAGDCNRNWSGWSAGSGSGNGFEGVRGNWNAECIGGSPDSGEYTSWVGLGGDFPGESLEQTGILEQGDGTYRMFWAYAWHDPSSPSGISITETVDQNDVVSCTQHIYASVEYGSRSGYCGTGQWRPYVTDTSNGTSMSPGCMPESHGFGIQSAEWVDERPSDDNVCAPQSDTAQLTDFNWTDWSDLQAQANYSGAGWVAAGGFANNRFVMHDDGTGQDLAYPDQASLGSSFTDRWYHYGTWCDS